MEQDIIFVSLNEFYSKKKEQTYYTVVYLLDKSAITEFISEEVYRTLCAVKLNYLGKYKGVFNVNGSQKLQLVNIK